MYVMYLRSSSVGTFKWCQHQYFLRYVLILPDKPNKKAVKGNIVHKAMELLAKGKLCIQEGREEIDDELGRIKLSFALDERAVLDLAYAHYSKGAQHFDWDENDFRECESWLNTAITYSGAAYDPRKCTIFFAEKFFDISFPDTWASYEYNINGEIIKGQLSIKGHIDLAVQHGDNLIEIIDYKTGEDKNYEENRPKTDEELYNDFQLRLYHYAVSKLYPDFDVMMTIFFIRKERPVTLPYDKSTLLDTEKRIRAAFETIKNTDKPAWIWGSWKCKRLCKYYEDKIGDLSVCESFRQKVLAEGADKVAEKHCNKIALATYQDGGGTSLQGRTH